MQYLSIDLEATGLKENDYIIEVGIVPVSSDSKTIHDDLSFHSYIKCPSFESLAPNLDEWVINHNKELINKAHNSGINLQKFQQSLTNYLNSSSIKDLFQSPDEKIVLLGKSLNAIDLPFLNRDLGWNFMRNYFHHQVVDISCITRYLIDLNKIPAECISGSKLNSYLALGEVSHTALEDAIQTAKQYLKLIELLES